MIAAALRLMEQPVANTRDGQAHDLIEEGWIAAQRGETVDGDSVSGRIDEGLEALETPMLR